MRHDWRLVALGAVLVPILAACGSSAAAREEANKAVVRRYSAEVGNKGNLAVVDEVLAENYVRHSQATGGDTRGRDAVKALYREWRTSLSAYSETIEIILAEGDYVAAVVTVRGTQTGNVGPFPPSGKTMECRAIGLHRLENGRIAETWVEWDNHAVMAQLGHLPPPPGSPAGP